jgi:hypothetical protein
MIKNKKLTISLTAVFLILESLLGILLQTAQDTIPINLRYTAIILACLFCILFAERSLSYLFTQTALVFTVAADFFLVYADPMQQLPGMLFFSVTQIAYFLRLYFEDGKVYIESSDAARIVMTSANRRYKVACADKVGETISNASFEITPELGTYVRFTVKDTEGREAYTNAYFLSDLI